MQSLKELYKIGRGPSSSHTLAPERACALFTETFGPYPYYEVELYGSLSLTGKGHRTDDVIRETLPGETTIAFKLDWEESFPNGFYLRSYNEKHELQHSWTVFSLGGGSISIKEKPLDWNDEVYTETSYREVSKIMKEHDWGIPQYIESVEPDLKDYLLRIIDAEVACVEAGLHTEGVLPGKLKIERVASKIYAEAKACKNPSEQERLFLMAFAYAASEENAAGHTVVTAPTLGACGILASMVYYFVKIKPIDRDTLAEALAVGGLFGNLIKQNATISGAVGGCQAEVGAAVSMASAVRAYLSSGSTGTIEYAAEIGMEHHLGLTCDPVMGYVMIPCIERNAMGVLRACDAALLAGHMSNLRHHMISFDMVVETMKATGDQIPLTLKETSIGGLALEFSDHKVEG